MSHLATVGRTKMVDPSQLRILMTVHCEGDCRVIEQLGEKQDFESELSRLGFKHEHFMLFISAVRTLSGCDFVKC